MSENNEDSGQVLKKVRLKRLFIPIVLGLGVVFFMLYSEIEDMNKLQVKLHNEAVYEDDWKTISTNKGRDSVLCTINDSSIVQFDTLKLSIRYVVEQVEGGTKMFVDTLQLTAGSDSVIQNKEKYLKAAYREDGKNCVFIFTRPLKSVFSLIRFSWKVPFWLLIAMLMMVVRDFGYMWRIRILTKGELSWRQCFYLIMLWECTSAVSPSAVGGSGVAIYLAHKEGLNVGRSTAVIMSTIFLDELYFLVFILLVYFFVGGSALFTVQNLSSSEAVSFTNEFFYFAVIAYIVIFAFTAFLGYGLFVNPRGAKWLLLKLFKLPILRKWRAGANQTGTDLIISSKELVKESKWFWTKAFGATVFSWTGRYWIVNILLMGLIDILSLPERSIDHFLLFARQLIMWIMMIVSPTPGGSGFAEYVFSKYLGQFISPISLIVLLALLWRLITYYPYLFLGTYLIPRWIRIKFGKKKDDNKKNK